MGAPTDPGAVHFRYQAEPRATRGEHPSRKRCLPDSAHGPSLPSRRPRQDTRLSMSLLTAAARRQTDRPRFSAPPTRRQAAPHRRKPNDHKTGWRCGPGNTARRPRWGLVSLPRSRIGGRGSTSPAALTQRLLRRKGGPSRSRLPVVDRARPARRRQDQPTISWSSDLAGRCRCCPVASRGTRSETSVRRTTHIRGRGQRAGARVPHLRDTPRPL